MLRKIICSSIVFMVIMLSPVTGQSRETLAVLDFTTEAVSKTEMTAIVEFLSAELFNTNKYNVIDVSQRETILQEMEFSMSGCSDESCALEVGKLLSAELIVVGNLSKVGSRYLMSVKMLQTETSMTIGTANGKFVDLDELIDGLEIIAFDLSGGRNGSSAADAPTAEPVQTVATAETAVTDKPSDTPDVITSGTEEEPEAAPAVLPEAQPIQQSSDDGAFNIAAAAVTGTGVVGLGVGGYFLIKLFTSTLPAYQSAAQAYTDAAFGSDFDTLWTARSEAYDAAFGDLLIGTIAAGAGVILTTIGVILFLPPAENEGTLVSVMPIVTDNPGLVVRVSY